MKRMHTGEEIQEIASASKYAHAFTFSLSPGSGLVFTDKVPHAGTLRLINGVLYIDAVAFVRNEGESAVSNAFMSATVSSLEPEIADKLARINGTKVSEGVSEGISLIAYLPMLQNGAVVYSDLASPAANVLSISSYLKEVATGATAAITLHASIPLM